MTKKLKDRYRIVEFISISGISTFRTEYHTLSKGCVSPNTMYTIPDTESWIGFGEISQTREDAEKKIMSRENNRIKKIIYHPFN